MGKLAKHTGGAVTRAKVRELSGLRRERQRLLGQLARIDARLKKASPASNRSREVTVTHLDQLLDELSAGLPELPLLPTSFSRADLYEDHD